MVRIDWWPWPCPVAFSSVAVAALATVPSVQLVRVPESIHVRRATSQRERQSESETISIASIVIVAQRPRYHILSYQQRHGERVDDGEQLLGCDLLGIFTKPKRLLYKRALCLLQYTLELCHFDLRSLLEGAHDGRELIAWSGSTHNAHGMFDVLHTNNDATRFVYNCRE
jgi:hypothetical protein